MKQQLNRLAAGCEALDQKIETFLGGTGYVLGVIKNWRDRTLEATTSSSFPEDLQIISPRRAG